MHIVGILYFLEDAGTCACAHRFQEEFSISIDSVLIIVLKTKDIVLIQLGCPDYWTKKHALMNNS